jgi:3-isopropylmalate/(R)-2-methylmalate dehydratase small subunit
MLNNGLLPVKVSEEFLKEILEGINENPDNEIAIDVELQSISFKDTTETFEIDSYKKICLLNGYDDIDFLISKKQAITEFELKTQKKMSNNYFKIAVLPGDGIGPEIISESIKILDVIAEAFQYKFQFDMD